MALPNPNIRCKEALPRIASLAKNQCNKEAGCREATAIHCHPLPSTAIHCHSNLQGHLKVAWFIHASSIFINVSYVFPYFPYWTWHNLIHFGGIHRYPSVSRHFQTRPTSRVQAIDEAMCEMVPSFLKLLQSPLTVLSLGQLDHHGCYCLWNPISVFGCFWRFPGNVGRQSNISHQVSPERFMGTPTPYPNDPKITEEGKAMSSKLGSAGGTAHCDG